MTGSQAVPRLGEASDLAMDIDLLEGANELP